METKTVKLKLKEILTTGEFTGLASVYGNRDRGGDIITPGAFTKTISDNGGKVPLLYGHRTTIGVSFIEDSPEGLLNKGVLNLEKTAAADVYSDLKFFHDKGVPFGMSIGYIPVADKIEYKGDTRLLHEVKLFETTLTEFPMNPRAQVMTVKSDSYPEILFEQLEMLQEEIKSGRQFSQANIDRLRSIAEQIMTLISESPEAAAKCGIEPAADHSNLASAIKAIRGMIPL